VDGRFRTDLQATAGSRRDSRGPHQHMGVGTRSATAGVAAAFLGLGLPPFGLSFDDNGSPWLHHLDRISLASRSAPWPAGHDGPLDHPMLRWMLLLA